MLPLIERCFCISLILLSLLIIPAANERHFDGRIPGLELAAKLQNATAEQFTASLNQAIPEQLSAVLPVFPSFDPHKAIEQFEAVAEYLDYEILGPPATYFNVTKQCLAQYQYYIKAQLGFLGASLQNCTYDSPEETAQCNTNKTIMSLTNAWSLTVADAFGKVSPGTLNGNVFWWGSFGQCRRLEMTYADQQFKWQYFLGRMTVNLEIAGGSNEIPLQVGLCFPDSCTPYDVGYIIGILENALVKGAPPTFKSIESRKDVPLKERKMAIGGVAFCSIWLFIMVLGTTYDYFWLRRPFAEYEDKKARSLATADRTKNQSFFGKLLHAFSIISNGEKIMSMKKSPRTIGCLHGMRFLSMCWIILGHSIFFANGFTDNIIDAGNMIYNNYVSTMLTNATMSVDTFFFLSAFLVAYLFFGEAQKQKGKNLKNPGFWLMFYVHRYLRLTPVYMLVIFLELSLLWYAAASPTWHYGVQTDQSCQVSWWTNMIYLNNFLKKDKQCLGWSWYLANDMQFYVFSPLVTVPLFFLPPLGIAIGSGFIVSGMLYSGVMTGKYDYPPNSLAALPGAFTGNAGAYYWDVYVKPYARWSPYAVGLMFGYLMHRLRGRTVRIPYLLKFIFRFLALGMNYLLVYGLFDYARGKKDMSKVLNGFYSGTSRTIWAVNLCYIVFECMTGNGGVIDRILSQPIWLPFSRLTYCAYLIHPIVELTWYTTRDVPFHYDSAYTLVYTFAGHMAIVYAIALVFSLAFEAPFLGLEKLLLGGALTRSKRATGPRVDPHVAEQAGGAATSNVGNGNVEAQSNGNAQIEQTAEKLPSRSSRTNGEPPAFTSITQNTSVKPPSYDEVEPRIRITTGQPTQLRL